MTPDRKDCLAWLRSRWTVRELDHGAIVVISRKVRIPFSSPEQAYRRLGGPDDGRMGSGSRKPLTGPGTARGKG